MEFDLWVNVHFRLHLFNLTISDVCSIICAKDDEAAVWQA